jgi:hypothetical protein
MAHCHDCDNAAEALRRALNDAEISFTGLRRRAPKENYEHPYASMMFVRAADGHLDALWYGDCGAFVKRPGEDVEVVGEAFDKRAAEARRVAMLANAKGLPPAAGINRPEFMSALRAARNTVNTEKGGWLFGPHSQAADHARGKAIEAPSGTLLLLASDGFLALASDYGLYDANTLVAAAEKIGLESLGAELRALESTDPEGVKYPRFKKSDDATAVLLRVS